MTLLAKHYHYDGKRYDFIVTERQQARCPRWDAEREANPPLSAAHALAKANKFIANFKTKDSLVWELDALALINVAGWMWSARYRLTKKIGIMTGAWPEMGCWILMDGTVVEPTITEDEK